MPEANVLRSRAARNASENAPEVPSYDTPLHLPSSIKSRSACTLKLRQYEFKIREAQAYEALAELREQLQLRTHMYKFKDKNIVGQSASTRCQNLIKRVQVKLKASAAKYTLARGAMTRLSVHTADIGWQTILLPLRDEDIRPLRDVEADLLNEKHKKRKEASKPGASQPSEGHRTLSWIWKVTGVEANAEDDGLQEGEFLQSYLS